MNPTLAATIAIVGTLLSLIGLITTAINAWMSLKMRTTLAEFQNDFIRELNGRYLKKELYEAYQEGVNARLKRLEQDRL